ncbi:protein rolling stone-like [Condylostylus longicornis]|uniref:protein rolling stone-like n=1 Tax=Condylostylus longicornis TaxID=2530218 RepID=UPI00244E5B79|nr:protein rolling stone-like [Condylostylus longicornis]
MMVSKIWNKCFPELHSEYQVHRHNFYLCQWQRGTQVGILYLFYRWLTAITCLAVVVCSLLDIGHSSDEQFENHYAKWWIYLTNWGLLVCAIQAWFAAWIVTQGMMVRRDDFELVRRMNKSYFHNIYWVLYTVATVYSFIISLCYWCLVHNPEIHKVDTLNIMVHVFNSVIMLIDLAIVGHPIKLGHIYYTTVFGAIYALFTGIYYLAGGTDRLNRVAIYPLLDWTKPGKAVIVSICAVIFVAIVHFLCYTLYRLRVCLFKKLCVRHLNNHDIGELDDGLNSEYQHQQNLTKCPESAGNPGICSEAFVSNQISYEHQYQQLPQSHQQFERQYHTLSSQCQDNNNKDKIKFLTASVSEEQKHEEQFVNPNKILEYKM